MPVPQSHGAKASPQGAVRRASPQYADGAALAAAGGFTALSVAMVAYTETAGTDADTSVATTWTTVDINTEQFDPDGIVSVASSQFTLGAGTYIIEATHIFHDCNRARIRLYNDSGSVAIVGESINDFTDTTYEQNVPVSLTTVVTLAGVTNLELQRNVLYGGQVLGHDQNTDFTVDAEHYATVMIWQVAA